MPRIRTIKPDAFRSISLAHVPIEARWLFAGLWTEADDEGVLRDHPGLIRAALFPLDDLPVDRVEGWLSDLADEGCICRYEVDGAALLHIPAWHHQRINRATQSTLPGCPKHRAVLAPVREISPAREAAPAVNPRRCPDHQSGPAVRCGACREARVAHEEAVKSKPTLSAKTTMCGEHPEHPARACPECAAVAVPPPPTFRPGRKARPS